MTASIIGNVSILLATIDPPTESFLGSAPWPFDTTLALGLITGIAFGFLLQKGWVNRFEVIVRQFLLEDFTMLKVMLTAVVVGGFGVYGLICWDAGTFIPSNELILGNLHVKPTVLGAQLAGGVIFGIGIVLLGYCPGTSIAAFAQGSFHAFIGFLGMLCGAMLYAEAYPHLKNNLLSWGKLDAQILPQLLSIPYWTGLAAFAVILVLMAFISRVKNV
jgi:uncharacterized membrane protein YedE/YeeE